MNRIFKCIGCSPGVPCGLTLSNIDDDLPKFCIYNQGTNDQDAKANWVEMEQGPAVDEQKRKMALAIDRDWCQVGFTLLKCNHCDAKGLDDQNFNHREKCIVPIAQQYLKDLEGK